MVLETGNRLCSESELITAILKDYLGGNKSILEELFRNVHQRDIVLLNCAWFSGGRSGEYEVIGRINCMFDPGGDIPDGLSVERRTGWEFVLYKEIVSYNVLSEGKIKNNSCYSQGH